MLDLLKSVIAVEEVLAGVSFGFCFRNHETAFKSGYLAVILLSSFLLYVDVTI